MPWRVNRVSEPTPVALCSRFLFLVFFLLFVQFPAVSAAPVLSIDEKTTVERLDTYLDALENTGGQYQPGDILRPQINNRFTPLKHNVPGAISAYGSDMWLRFIVANRSQETQILWFTANHRAVRSVNLYRQQPDSLERVPDAPMQNDGSAPVLKSLELAPQQQTAFYLQVTGLQSHSLQPMLVAPETYFIENLSQHRLASFGIGMLLFNALLVAVLAGSRRSRLFLYQAGFVLSIALVQLAGYGVPELGLDMLEQWQYTLAFVFVYMACVTVVMISRETLRMHGLPLKRQNQLNAVLVFVHVSFLLLLVTTAGYSPLLLLIVAVVCVAIVTAGFYCYSCTGDIYTLAVTCVKLANILFLSAYFLYNHSWVFIQLIDSVVLYSMVVETALISLIYILAEYRQVSQTSGRQRLLDMTQLKNSARAELLDEISHDIRTPVSNIIGVAGLLKESALSVGQAEKINIISDSAQLMLNKLAEFQARAEAQSSGAQPQQSPFELVLLIETCVKGFQIKAENQSSELVMHIQPDVPDIVYGDPARIRQVLVQLLAHAVERTSQGEILVRVARQASDPDVIAITVQDSGPIPTALYNNGDKTAVVDPGLEAVDQLLKTMDSRLCYTRDEMQGNRFYFSVNLAQMHKPESWGAEDEAALKNKHLLVVDDNHASCKVLRQQATSWGMQVTEAYDGNQAVAVFKARQNLNEPFDAILMDYDMPQLSGIDAAGRIMAESDTRPLIVMLTGLTSMPSDKAIREAGIAAVLNKPASPKLIRLTLGNLLNMSGQNKSGMQDITACKLLVVDDNDVSRRVVSKLLDALSVNYRLAADGQLACDAVKRESFDLILMDCEMPLMDGFESTCLIHQWQRQRSQPLTPVVAMTAHTLGYYQNKSGEAGMVDFLEKPVHLNELRNIILRHVLASKKDV